MRAMDWAPLPSSPVPPRGPDRTYGLVHCRGLYRRPTDLEHRQGPRTRDGFLDYVVPVNLVLLAIAVTGLLVGRRLPKQRSR